MLDFIGLGLLISIFSLITTGPPVFFNFHISFESRDSGPLSLTSIEKIGEKTAFIVNIILIIVLAILSFKYVF